MPNGWLPKPRSLWKVWLSWTNRLSKLVCIRIRNKQESRDLILFIPFNSILLYSIPDNCVNQQKDRRYGIPVHKGGDGPDPCHLATKRKYPVKNPKNACWGRRNKSKWTKYTSEIVFCKIYTRYLLNILPQIYTANHTTLCTCIFYEGNVLGWICLSF